MRVLPEPGRPNHRPRLSRGEYRKRMRAVGKMFERRAAAMREHKRTALDIARRTDLPVADVIDALAEGRAPEELLGLAERCTWHRTRIGRDLDAWQSADPHGARLG